MTFATVFCTKVNLPRLLSALIQQCKISKSNLFRIFSDNSSIAYLWWFLVSLSSEKCLRLNKSQIGNSLTQFSKLETLTRQKVKKCTFLTEFVYFSHNIQGRSVRAFVLK
jgi:hypothetical protein